MQYERNIDDEGVVIYKMNGDFTIFFLNTIKSDIEKDISSGKAAYFVFDFENVHYIDSAAISLLIMTGKYNDSRGKTLRIKNPKDVVRRIIDNADLSFIEFE